MISYTHDMFPIEANPSPGWIVFRASATSWPWKPWHPRHSGRWSVGWSVGWKKRGLLGGFEPWWYHGYTMVIPWWYTPISFGNRKIYRQLKRLEAQEFGTTSWEELNFRKVQDVPSIPWLMCLCPSNPSLLMKSVYDVQSLVGTTPMHSKRGLTAIKMVADSPNTPTKV